MPTLHGRFVTFSKFCCNWLVAVHKTRSERILLCTVVTTLCAFEGLLVVYLLFDSFWLILIVFLGQISSIKQLVNWKTLFFVLPFYVIFVITNYSRDSENILSVYHLRIYKQIIVFKVEIWITDRCIELEISFYNQK